MRYCGLDVSKDKTNYCIMNDKRKILSEGVVENTRTGLAKKFRGRKPMRIAIEAVAQSFWLADILRGMGHDPVLVDPYKTKAIGASLIKNDVLDARVLAELCRGDVLAAFPESDGTFEGGTPLSGPDRPVFFWNS